MNAKGALISVLCIGLVAMTAGAGTLAYFSDTETSTGNTFTAGTLDIKDLEDNKIIGMNIVQGDATGEFDWVIVTHPDASIPPDHLELKLSTNNFYNWDGESGSTANTKDDFTKQILITEFRYMDGTVVDLMLVADDSLDGNPGYLSLYDVEYGGIYDNLPTIGLSAGCIGLNCKFGDPTIPDEAHGNYYQGDSVEIVFDVAACQAPGQDVLVGPRA